MQSMVVQVTTEDHEAEADMEVVVAMVDAGGTDPDRGQGQTLDLGGPDHAPGTEGEVVAADPEAEVILTVEADPEVQVEVEVVIGQEVNLGQGHLMKMGKIHIKTENLAQLQPE